MKIDAVSASKMLNDISNGKIVFPKRENNLERSPKSDTVELSSENLIKNSEKNVNAPVSTPLAKPDDSSKVQKTEKIKKVKSSEKLNHSKTQKKLDIIEKEKLLTDEVLYFLKPKEDSKGNKVFTLSQTKVINVAFDKLVFFKEISIELAEDAKKYSEKIKEDFVKIFGGKEGMGKYIIEPRAKDDVSVCNKLIKEFKNERVKNQIHNIFSKKLYNKPYALLDNDEKKLVLLSIKDGEVKLDSKDMATIENTIKTNPKNVLAKKYFSKPFLHLSSEERKMINDLAYMRDTNVVNKATNTQARKDAIDWVRDLVGIRMVLPTGSRAELSKVERYIDKAIMNGKMKITRVSNYHGSYILPYIKLEKVDEWAEKIPGMIVVENSVVRKKNGYTTTQINLDHYVEGRRKPILVEFQLRTEPMNEIGNRQHLIYDILEGKDITKGIPELKEYFDSIGLVDAVNEVFQNSKLENKYIDYERAYFSYLRNEESDKKLSMQKPFLFKFGLGQYEELLSFEALETINNKVDAIKKQFGKKIPKTKQEKLEYLHKLQQ